MTFKDARTEITFYVETDGRHLAAIDADGDLLWVRNPFEDRNLCPYRNKRPVIDTIKVAESDIQRLSEQPELHINPRDKYIEIEFDSSQFGYVNERTGYFTPLGQN